MLNCRLGRTINHWLWIPCQKIHVFLDILDHSTPPKKQRKLFLVYSYRLLLSSLPFVHYVQNEAILLTSYKETQQNNAWYLSSAFVIEKTKKSLCLFFSPFLEKDIMILNATVNLVIIMVSWKSCVGFSPVWDIWVAPLRNAITYWIKVHNREGRILKGVAWFLCNRLIWIPSRSEIQTVVLLPIILLYIFFKKNMEYQTYQMCIFFFVCFWAQGYKFLTVQVQVNVIVCGKIWWVTWFKVSTGGKVLHGS